MEEKIDLKDILPHTEVRDGDMLVDVLVRIGFATSKREARYFITSGAVSLRKIHSS